MINILYFLKYNFFYIWMFEINKILIHNISKQSIQIKGMHFFIKKFYSKISEKKTNSFLFYRVFSWMIMPWKINCKYIIKKIYTIVAFSTQLWLNSLMWVTSFRTCQFALGIRWDGELCCMWQPYLCSSKTTFLPRNKI